MFEQMLQGFLAILNVQSLGMVLIGLITGMVFGALPGLTTAMAMGLFVPITFFMKPLIGIPFLIGLYKGGIYGGSVPAILISTPGTGAAAATVIDGYELTKKGKAGKALKMAIYASTIGDAFSDIVVLFTLSTLGALARKIGVVEIFSILIFSFTIIAAVSGESIVKGLISACLGLLFSLIGIDIFTGTPRLTFNSINLQSGISFVPMLIGLFAFSELIILTEEQFAQKKKYIVNVVDLKKSESKVTKKEFFQCLPAIMKGSVLGTIVGIIPGIGQPIAAFLSYGVSKNTSKHSEEFGKGTLEGVAAAESGNNAVDGATLVPLLTLGIPGDVITAIMLGAFVAQGLRPGPFLMRDYPVEMYGILTIMVIANIFMLAVALALIPGFQKIIQIPKSILVPLIFTFATVGTYAVNNNPFDLFVMYVFGLLGYVMRKNKFPLAPIVILFLLGSMTERALGQTLIKGQGSLGILFQRPFSATMMVITILVFIFMAYTQYRTSKKLKGKID